MSYEAAFPLVSGKAICWLPSVSRPRRLAHRLLGPSLPRIDPTSQLAALEYPLEKSLPTSAQRARGCDDHDDAERDLCV